MNTAEDLHKIIININSQPSMDADLKDRAARIFVCSCGKDYLSYAALFTHIKQKHGGKVSPSICRHQVP